MQTPTVNLRKKADIFFLSERNGAWIQELSKEELEQIFIAISEHFPNYAASKEAAFIVHFSNLALQLEHILQMGIASIEHFKRKFDEEEKLNRSTIVNPLTGEGFKKIGD